MLAPLCSLQHVYSSQALQAAQVLTSRPVDKKVAALLYSGMLLGHKKNRTVPFATAWLDLQGIMLGEITQRKKNAV